MNATNWTQVEAIEADIATAHKAGDRTAERAARARWELAMGIGTAPVAPKTCYAVWAKGTILATAR